MPELIRGSILASSSFDLLAKGILLGSGFFSRGSPGGSSSEASSGYSRFCIISRLFKMFIPLRLSSGM